MAVSTPSLADVSSAGMFRPRRVRLDDVTRGVGFEFADVQQVFVAAAISEVAEALRAAEAAAAHGAWVVGFVTYDAAAAFDVAFPPAASTGTLPLAWFAAFGRRDEVELVQPAASGPFVAELERTGGSVRKGGVGAARRWRRGTCALPAGGCWPGA